MSRISSRLRLGIRRGQSRQSSDNDCHLYRGVFAGDCLWYPVGFLLFSRRSASVSAAMLMNGTFRLLFAEKPAVSDIARRARQEVFNDPIPDAYWLRCE